MSTTRKAVGGPFKVTRKAGESAEDFSQRVTRIIVGDKAIVSAWFETGSLCRRCATDYVTDGHKVEMWYTDTGCYNCAE